MDVRSCRLLSTASLVSGLATLALSPAQAQRGVYEDAYRQGDWQTAASAAERWAQRQPKDSSAAYNAACAFSLLGDQHSALEWLRRAGDRGFAGLRSIEEDPDLEFARRSPEFEKATATIRQNRAQMFAAFRDQAEQAEILTIVPKGEPKPPLPLIVVLHGYGGSPAANASRYRKVAAELGAVIAAPSALRPGPRGQGFSWTFRDEAEWWVLRAIERVSEKYPIDSERIVLAGFSQGANIALSVGFKYPDHFTGLLPVASHYEPHLMPSPTNGGPRVYLLTGALDPAAKTFVEAHDSLAAAGLEVRLRVIPQLGHSYPVNSAKELRTALRFLLEP